MTRSTKNLARFSAFAAASLLALSGCTSLGGILGGTGTPGSSQASDGGSSAAAGRTSTAVGTNGMQPIPKLTAPQQSAAMGIDADPAKDERWADYYTQEAQWEKCDNPGYNAAQCATIEVPLKWNEPEGARLELLLTRVESSGEGEAKGSILMNPGGPGGSGAEHVAMYGTMTTTQLLRDNYNLIGFDPRGVKDSSGIKCLDDKDTDTYLSATFDTETEEGIKESEEWSKKIADACQANSGDILQYLDTYSAARDMDVIRQVVKSEKLDYLGFSYGTYLGATYAELYPERTGHLVLDGALDPALSADEISAGQAKGFEDAVHAFMDWCLNERGQCPFSGTTEDGLKQLQDFMAKTDKTPIATSSGRELTGALATSAIISTMYSDETWEYLALGYEEALNGRGDVLLLLADHTNERNDDGTFKSNSTFAITAVNCLDRIGVTDEKWVEKESERLADQYPTFGGMLGGAGLSCAQWPAKAVREPAEIHAKGSAPIVVIGTTGDPATPYEWAVTLNEQLANSSLITFKGNGHTAYSRSGGCVEELVDEYFINDTVPEDGATCES